MKVENGLLVVCWDLDSALSVLGQTGALFSKKADSLKAAPPVLYRTTATDAIKTHQWKRGCFYMNSLMTSLL
jgi:hypothetical protein